MISLGNWSRRSVSTALLISLTMSSSCITSKDVLLNDATTPMKAGKYEVQYLVDRKWTTFGGGSLALVNRKYTWAEDSEAAALLMTHNKGLTACEAGKRKL